MLMFTLSISYLTTFNLLWFMDLTFQVPNIVFYSIGLTSITSHIHNWILFSRWLHFFIVSGVISPLFSSSILGEFIFRCHIFLPFCTVHGVLKAIILKWFALPSSGGPWFVRTLHHDPSILGGPTQHGSCFHWVRQGSGPCDQFD